MPNISTILKTGALPGGAIFVALVLSCAMVSAAADVLVEEIDLTYCPECLPYRFTAVKIYGGGTHFRWIGSVDYDRDGGEEVIYAYSNDAGGCSYSSAVVGMSDDLTDDVMFQYNGIYANRLIWDVFALDVAGDDGDDVVLIRAFADSVIMEILVLGDSGISDTLMIPAAVIRPEQESRDWHDLFIVPHMGIDLNSDGVKEVIFGRSGKVSGGAAEDSAFARGVVAYDVVGDSAYWFYPTADLVGVGRFHAVTGAQGVEIFVAVTLATDNSYTANGMDSKYAYAFAIDKAGKEIWRQTIATAYYYSQSTVHDGNNDGLPEFYVSYQDTSSTSIVNQLHCLDPFTGNTLTAANPIAGAAAQIYLRPDSTRGKTYIYSFSEDSLEGRIYRYDLSLRLDKIVAGNFGTILAFADIIGAGYPQVLVSSYSNKAVLLDSALRPLAIGTWVNIHPLISVYHGHERLGFLVEHQLSSVLYGVGKNTLGAMLFARYKWWLAVVLAMAGFAGLLRLWLWIRRLRMSTLGLPSLDRINAMVLVLDRKGRINYTNTNPLVRRLFGEEVGRSQRYDRTALTEYPDIVAAVKRSFDDPYRPLQERIDITGNGQKLRLELVIYPRIERGNVFIGKIVIAEDITGRLGWERKAVLGEAAQRWVHKLKGNMATANLYLDNLMEDRRVTRETAASGALAEYHAAIKRQLVESVETATKILRFVRIGKPERIESDLNRIIETVVAGYRGAYPDITMVTKLQPDLPMVFVDPEQMLEVFDNLLSNAIRAVGKEGIVTITSRTASGLLSKSSEKTIQVCIEDSGCGIAAEDLERIFMPGFSRSGNGTGLGLAIVKEIVDNHDGRIEVESTKGRGTRFTITLPLEVSINDRKAE